MCRVQEHALLPNETIYTRAYFPLPQDQDYYIVGFLADIVNKIHVHHFVVTFCTEPVSELYNNPNSEPGFPEQPVDERDLGTFQGSFFVSAEAEVCVGIKWGSWLPRQRCRLLE